MRRKAALIYVLLLLFFFLWLHPYIRQPFTNQTYEYYKNHFIRDTGAHNAVTAIYLNYRFFDTLFEALMLLISVIGIIYFSRHEGGHKDG